MPVLWIGNKKNTELKLVSNTPHMWKRANQFQNMVSNHNYDLVNSVVQAVHSCTSSSTLELHEHADVTIYVCLQNAVTVILGGGR